MFQTDGPVSKNDLSPNSFVFTRGMTMVRVWDAERNSLVRVSGCTKPEEGKKIPRGFAGEEIDEDG